VRRSEEGGRVLADGPDLGLQEVEEGLRLGGGVEVEVDDDVARIVDWTLDAMVQYAGLLAELGDAVEPALLMW
jgi:hypothetical protein